MQSPESTPITKTAGLSKTLESRPGQMENFTNAFKYMEENVRRNQKLNPEEYGRYSSLCFGQPIEDWPQRYTHPRNIEIASQVFKNFYSQVEDAGYLNLESLAKLYDQLGTRELLLDGNGRGQVLALSHVLLSFGYQPPDMTKVTKQTMNRLREKYPKSIDRNIAFIKLILPEDNRPPIH